MGARNGISPAAPSKQPLFILFFFGGGGGFMLQSQ